VINGDTIFNYYIPDTARFPQAEYVLCSAGKSAVLLGSE
jgi:hypothetical protein